MSVFVHRQVIDLARENAPAIRAQKGIRGDKDALSWAVTVLEDGAPAALAGYTAQLFCCRADGSTIIGGAAISGHVITASLPGDAYNVPGLMTLLMRIKKGETAAAAAEMVVLVEDPIGEDVRDSTGSVWDILMANALAAHPVGSLYITLSDEFPGVTFGGGDWVREAQGRAIFGAGTIEQNGGNMFGNVVGGWSMSNGSSSGEDFHFITEQELPKVSGDITFHGLEVENHATFFFGASGVFAGSPKFKGYVSTPEQIGDLAPSLSSIKFRMGGGLGAKNIPPYKAFNVWRRTA